MSRTERGQLVTVLGTVGTDALLPRVRDNRDVITTLRTLCRAEGVLALAAACRYPMVGSTDDTCHGRPDACAVRGVRSCQRP